MRTSYFRAYILAALLMAVILSPLPYSTIAAFLLLLHLYLVWKNPARGLILPINLLSVIILPSPWQVGHAEVVCIWPRMVF